MFAPSISNVFPDNTQLIAHSVATYARSFKGFPERTSSVAPAAYKSEAKYHGSMLYI
jgi:aminopeptidase Y